jgi:hypothetical protein
MEEDHSVHAHYADALRVTLSFYHYVPYTTPLKFCANIINSHHTIICKAFTL